MRLHLHHIGILVKDISKTVANYEKIYNCKKKSNIIHDPIQTAFVQFLTIQDNNMYTELIAPDGQNSKLMNALKKGGGIHHLCYLTDDLESTCVRLSSTGMLLLQEPVAAVAFGGRRIAWVMGLDGVPVELLEGVIDKWEKD
ncbi:MAG: VOC family protein [Bacillota bacterium]